LVLIEVGIHLEFLQGFFWRVMATGFEAGTIGALADWFAVSALFHRIPLPLIGRHTNIIVKNRRKLTEAIVELVTTKWLSPDIIYQKLEGIRITKGLFNLLEKPKNLRLAVDFVRHVLLQLISSLDGPQVVTHLKGWFKEQVNSADIAAPLGRWLEKMVLNGGHAPLVDRLLRESSRALDESTTRAIIHDKLKDVLRNYERQDFIKKAAVRIGRLTGGIDIDVLTDRLLRMVQDMAYEAESNPDHPLRKKLDESLLELSEKLKTGDDSTVGLIERLKHKIVEDPELQSMFLGSVAGIKTAMEEQLSNNETALIDFIKSKAASLIERYKGNEDLLVNVDHWIKETIAQLVNKYHHEVGNTVRESLLKLNDQELVGQIKEKVGDDLQYIRLNGAVVGGLVGIVIAVARLLFL
jgi:uncharacterized membrane-anchored protein YjiN (DUF445 family)